MGMIDGYVAGVIISGIEESLDKSKKMIGEVCGDNRFEVIARAKKHLIERTNIETSADEMKVLDSFLFRCWQMGWLKRYESEE